MFKLITQVKGAKEIAHKFEKAQKDFDKMVFQAVQKSCYLVQRTAKNHLTSGNPLNVRDNRLRSSVRKKVNRKGFGKYEGRVGTNVIYGPVHEFGAIIRAKNKPMVFEVGGQTIKAWEVRIPKRPWLNPALEKNRKKILKLFDKDTLKLIKSKGL